MDTTDPTVWGPAVAEPDDDVYRNRTIAAAGRQWLFNHDARRFAAARRIHGDCAPS